MTTVQPRRTGVQWWLGVGEEGAAMGLQPAERQIVVGVDGSAASLAALKWAAREAGLRGTALRAVHVWEDMVKPRAFYASTGLRRRREDARAEAGARIEEAARAALGPQPGVQVGVDVVDGLPARVLLERSADADMLVLGTPSDPALDTLGPVAQACLRHARCPVVVVSEDEEGPRREPALAWAGVGWSADPG